MVKKRNQPSEIIGTTPSLREFITRPLLLLLAFLAATLAIVYGEPFRNQNNISVQSKRSVALVSACLRDKLPPIYSDFTEPDLCGSFTSQRITCRRDQTDFAAKNGNLRFSVARSNSGSKILISDSTQLQTESLDAIRRCAAG